MNIKLTDKAIDFFENEMELTKGDGIRFFGKTYGSTEVHEGFSVGLISDKPEDHEIYGQTEINGVIYFTGEVDKWFFENYDLEVDFDPDREEILYHFTD